MTQRSTLARPMAENPRARRARHDIAHYERLLEATFDLRARAAIAALLTEAEEELVATEGRVETELTGCSRPR